MTKSRQSAIKLRLSRLIRCLVALGCLKLAIMGFALFDSPMPAWQAGPQSAAEKAAPAEGGQALRAPIQAQAQTETANPVQAETTKEPAPIPLGSAAAELAAAAKPARAPGATVLPAPLAPAGPGSNFGRPGAFVAPLFPAPPSLGAPLARAGVILPRNEAKTKPAQADNIWDMLNLKSLPIPGLGSAQVAQAASLDMPVPATPPTQSPFTPSEQLAGSQPIVLPGAPPLPANLPHGQTAGGAPLPTRQPAFMDGRSPYAPETAPPLSVAPAPNIAPMQSPNDPLIKSQEMARQQQDIMMLRQQMDQRLKDLQTAEDKMKDMLRQAKDVEDKKVRSLVQMYANMKPRTAAQALEKMDERVAIRILSGMAPKQSGEILTYTNPSKTAKFTEMLTRLRMTD